MDRRTLLIRAGALSGFAITPGFASATERVLGGACEGCDWVFDGQPAKLSSRARIAPAAEPGVPMVLTGRVTTLRGGPAAGIVVYAYHTDRGGLYPPAGNRHGRLRGWAITDAQGQYRFDSIRPGAYPSRDVPEHVHMHVIEPGVGTYYIDNLEFEDDPLRSRQVQQGRGGQGLRLPQLRDGVWHVSRDIELGRNIDGYPSSGRGR
jgi:protocatechuate 3,4-dioxygenase beta subunit